MKEEDPNLKRIETEISDIKTFCNDIISRADKVETSLKDYVKKFNEELTSYDRERFLLNIIDDIKSTIRENKAAAISVDFASNRIEKARKELEKR